MDIRNVVLTGWLTKDPEVRNDNTGEWVLARLGFSQGKDKSGYISLFARNGAAAALRTQRKGSRVGVVGDLTFNDRDGDRHGVSVREVIYLSPRNTSTQDKEVAHEVPPF